MTEHSAIERYIEALETKDFKAVAGSSPVCRSFLFFFTFQFFYFFIEEHGQDGS